MAWWSREASTTDSRHCKPSLSSLGLGRIFSLVNFVIFLRHFLDLREFLRLSRSAFEVSVWWSHHAHPGATWTKFLFESGRSTLFRVLGQGTKPRDATPYKRTVMRCIWRYLNHLSTHLVIFGLRVMCVFKDISPTKNFPRSPNWLTLTFSSFPRLALWHSSCHCFGVSGMCCRFCRLWGRWLSRFAGSTGAYRQPIFSACSFSVRPDSDDGNRWMFSSILGCRWMQVEAVREAESQDQWSVTVITVTVSYSIFFWIAPPQDSFQKISSPCNRCKKRRITCCRFAFWCSEQFQRSIAAKHCEYFYVRSALLQCDFQNRLNKLLSEWFTETLQETALELKFVKHNICQMLPPLLSRQHEDHWDRDPGSTATCLARSCHFRSLISIDIHWYPLSIDTHYSIDVHCVTYWCTHFEMTSVLDRPATVEPQLSRRTFSLARWTHFTSSRFLSKTRTQKLGALPCFMLNFNELR